jgi:hypothetical protein
LLLLSLSAAAAALDGTELLRKVDRNMEPESYENYRKLVNIEPNGVKKEYVLYTAKKGRDTMIALFLDPPSERDRSCSTPGSPTSSCGCASR